MYVIERATPIEEKLKLVCGEKTKIVNVNLNVTNRLDVFFKNYRNIELCCIEAHQGGEEYEKYRQALIGLFDVVFKEDVAKEIIDFYDNDYEEMLIDIFPFIREVVFPAFEKERNRRMKQISDGLKD